MSAKAVAALCANGTVIPEVHVTPGLLEKIAHAVIDGYTASLHGGLEVGGLLFGHRDGAQVTAEKFRPLACDHSLGPRFLLSENDQRGLRELLEAPRIDPSLKGLEVVGWYCSHTRSELLLLDHELLLHDTYFAGQHQFILVFKPHDLYSVTAGIFSRNADRTIDPNHPSTILELLELRPFRNADQAFISGECDLPADCARPLPNLKEHASLLSRGLSALAGQGFDEFARQPPALAHPRPLESDKPRSSWAWKGAVISAAIVLAGIGAWKYIQLAPHAPELALNVRPYADNLLLSWKSNVAKPKHARVDIVDGSSSEHLNLTDIFQQSGVLLLPRNTGNVRATLTIYTGNGALVRRAGFSDSFDRARAIVIDDKNPRRETSTSSSPVTNQQVVTSPPVPRHAQSRHARHKRHVKRSRS